MTCDGPHQAAYLFDKFDSVIVDVIDFMLIQKSPKAKDEVEKRVVMGGSVNTVKLEDLVKIVSHLVVCKYTQQMVDLMEQNQHHKLPATCAQFTDHSIEVTAKTIDDPRQTKRMAQCYLIKEEEIEYLTNPDLMTLIFDQNLACAEYGKALAHVSFNNEKLSKKIAVQLLELNSKTKEEDFILSKLTTVVEFYRQDAERLSDSDLPTKRLEWLFGFPTLNHHD